MKTKALLLAAVLFATGTVASYAANDNNDKNAKDKTECTKGRKGQCKEGFNPFEGLNLTEVQQAKLKELRESSCPMKAETKADKKAHTPADKEAARVNRAAAKKEFLGKVKEILTPEQYVTFLENMAVNGQNHDKARMQKMMKQKGQKQRAEGNRAERSNK